MNAPALPNTDVKLQDRQGPAKAAWTTLSSLLHMEKLKPLKPAAIWGKRDLPKAKNLEHLEKKKRYLKSSVLKDKGQREYPSDKARRFSN